MASTSTSTSKKVLIIGRSPEVNQRVVAQVNALGFSAAGTTDMAQAAAFDARDFDLIAMGGGVDPATRAALRATFKEQNKDVLLLNAFAPVAAQQIARALSPDARDLASDFSLEDGGEEIIASVTILEACNLHVDIYRPGASSQPDAVRVVESSVPRGTHVFRFKKELARDAFLSVLTVNDEEHHVHPLAKPLV